MKVYIHTNENSIKTLLITRRKNPGLKPKLKKPVDKSGRVTTCGICGSRFHWVRKCPDREQNGEADKEKSSKKDDGDHEILITFAIDCKRLLSECKTRAILNAACTRTVAG